MCKSAIRVIIVEVQTINSQHIKMNALIIHRDAHVRQRWIQRFSNVDISVSTIHALRELRTWQYRHPIPDYIICQWTTESLLLLDWYAPTPPIWYMGKLPEAWQNKISIFGPPFDMEKWKRFVHSKPGKHTADFRRWKPNYRKSLFIVGLGGQARCIDVDEVAYFYKRNDATFLKTSTNGKFVIDYSLNDLASLLPSDQFVRVNRQYLVHARSIQKAEPYIYHRLSLSLEPPALERVIVSSQNSEKIKIWVRENRQ